jgi:hypothetical protein
VRTTLDIDDDVLLAAKEKARREKRTAGQVLSELARRGLTVRRPAASDLAEPEEFYGFRPLPRRGVVVTNELINAIRDHDPEG